MTTPTNHPSRRSVLASAASVAAGAAVAGIVSPAAFAADGPAQLKGNIRQSVCKWCYDKIPLETLAAEGKTMGLVAIDLLGPESFDTLKKHGLVCSMTNSHPIHPGLNKKKNHEVCLAKMRDAIEATSAAGFKNIICFSGNREGQDDEEGMKVCAEALKQIVGLAEQKKVTICMELLNSKVNHKDYMCDHTRWGVELCKMVGSERFKLLYDIYHMQIMEGDVIRTIRENKDYIGHIHTGGVPGRHEIDETQELYYPAIMKAIADMKFPGFVAQEFIPAREPIASLRQAVQICDV
jgi:hydroxypyruvate isomerase